MAAKKGLGRGFDSLIPTGLLDESFDPASGGDDNVSELRYIKTDTIAPDPDQPRRHFDELALEELADSIREHGILQPLVVTVAKSGYQIVAGERRWRAAVMAGLEKVPVLVRTLSDQHRLELSLIENVQRRDISPIEAAVAYARLRDQFNLTLDEIGQRVGNRSVSTISNTLRLLKLPKEAQKALLDGRLSEGQARPLIGLDDSVITDLVARIVREDWSARQVERFISLMKSDKKVTSMRHQARSYADDARTLGERFHTTVDIRVGAKGSGKIVIAFKDDDELRRLKEALEG